MTTSSVRRRRSWRSSATRATAKLNPCRERPARGSPSYLWRPCGPSPGSAHVLLAYASTMLSLRCAVLHPDLDHLDPKSTATAPAHASFPNAVSPLTDKRALRPLS